MLEQLKYKFILIICAFVGVIVKINQNARHERNNNPCKTLQNFPRVRSSLSSLRVVQTVLLSLHKFSLN